MEWSEELAGGLLQAAPDAILVMASDGRIVLINDRAEQLYGFGRDELLEGHGNRSVEGATLGWTEHEGHPWKHVRRGQCCSQHTPTVHFFTASDRF